jgi:archaellum component FlaC
MPDSRQARIANLTADVGRQRRVLAAVEFAEKRASPLHKDQIAARLREITDQLGKMEEELRGLRVQQIREELSG